MRRHVDEGEWQAGKRTRLTGRGRHSAGAGAAEPGEKTCDVQGTQSRSAVEADERRPAGRAQRKVLDARVRARQAGIDSVRSRSDALVVGGERRICERARNSGARESKTTVDTEDADNIG